MTLHWSVFKTGISFQYLHEGKLVPIHDWDHLVEFGHAQQLFIQELLDNAQAEVSQEALFISHEQISQFSSADLPLLNLPTRFKGALRIDSDGELGRSDFYLNYGFYDHHQGQKLALNRIGCLLQSQDQKQAYLINESQFKLCKELDYFSQQSTQERNKHQDCLAFSKIKLLAKEAGSHLDAYLTNENVFVPQELQLQLEVDQNDLCIQPEINFEDSLSFQERFERFPRIQSSYTVTKENEERVRIAFSSEQQKELEKVKKFKRVKGEEKQKLIQNPELFFDPDIINLDFFSERVLELGLYKPKFHPFISPYKSQWIPGFLVETSDQERHKIRFDSPETLMDFKQQIEIAKNQGKEGVQWQKFEIPIFEAVSILDIAEKQWQSPHTPYRPKESLGKKVLIIKENIETLEHQASDPVVLQEPVFIHRYTQPPSLKPGIKILNHQKEGIAWLQSLSGDGFSGALLADDMGLGKTLQGLAFIKWHSKKYESSANPYLIVAPVSLLENWEAEYEKFFDPDNLFMIKAYGDNLSKLIGHPSWLDSIQELQQHHIVLTTYETLRRNQLVFCAVEWSVVLLDEAQKIKNPGTLVTNSAKALKADFRLAATGTPVENTLVDLWCIMDFAIPGLLGSAKEFAQKYQNPLKSADTDIAQLGEQLRSQIGIHIKRRLKENMLDELPAKHIHRLQAEMPSIQMNEYLRILKQRVDHSEKQSMLNILFALKNISAYPFLSDIDISSIAIDQLIQNSAKFKLVYQLLQDIKAKQEKVILFSERRDMQLLIARIIQETFNFNPSIINGDTPASQQKINSAKLSRQQAVDRFQKTPGFNAIVISQLAAGVGLNITQANHVIHFSRHWNPAKEDQANDRAYRIGQTKDVHIYLPLAIAPNFKSFDVILDELLEGKRKLAGASLFPTEQAEINPEELFQKILEM